MFFRVVNRKHGQSKYRYLHLVENYRDPAQAGQPRQRLIHSFGNLAHIPENQRRRLVCSLNRALGLEVSSPELTTLDTRHFADLLALRSLWEELELPGQLRHLSAARKVNFDLDLIAFMMVAHRLIDPGSKLALTRWLPTAYLRDYELESIQLQHCYRALDLLDDIAPEIEEGLFLRLSNLFERELSLVFYDLTSSYFEGEGPPNAAYGYSRDRRPDQKQIVIGLAVDRRGLPISHLTFPGNRVDQQTLHQAVAHLQERFQIVRTIFVADGGVMSQANIEHLTSSGYQHLIALPKRRARARELAAGITWSLDDVIGENVMARPVSCADSPGLKYLVCYNPQRAEQEAQIRDARLHKATEALEGLQHQVTAGRLKDRDKILASAAAKLARLRARRYFEVSSAGDGHFEFQLRQEAVASRAGLDGYYFLQTDAELEPAEMLAAYKTLQRVEHAFRELKDTIRLRPIYHYEQARVRGHVFVCMLAYLLARLLELRLEAAGQPLSARAALEALEPVRIARNRLNERVIDCVVQCRPPQADVVLRALGLLPLPVAIES